MAIGAGYKRLKHFLVCKRHITYSNGYKIRPVHGTCLPAPVQRHETCVFIEHDNYYSYQLSTYLVLIT